MSNNQPKAKKPKRSKCQQFLEGRTVQEVQHSKGCLLLVLDNGATFGISAVVASDGFEYTGEYSLDFDFREGP